MLKFTLTSKTADKQIENITKKYGARGASKLTNELDKVVDRNAKRAAKNAGNRAPVDTGALKRSIKDSKTNIGPMEREIGSDLPYAQRQEYEHATKRAYFGTTMWELREPFRADVKRAIKKIGGM